MRHMQVTHWLIYNGTRRIACGKSQGRCYIKLRVTEDREKVTCVSCRLVMGRMDGVVRRVDEPVQDRSENRIRAEAGAMLSKQWDAQRKRWGWT